MQEHGAVKPSDEAPSSARKRKLIEDGRSTEELMVRGLADAAKNRGKQVILVEGEIVAWLKGETGRDLKPSVIRGWLRKAGLVVSGARFTVDGRATYVAGTLPLDEAGGWPGLAPHRVKPHELAVM